ncbi:hypothetical protein GUITHDRAFT_141058 [Guillardia theta CCMP2712]|uniref:Uncharacterized protein n=1 Tax=Guillardia theta (strain CCMP2712) TaxID=905079 RepID=L1J2U6_GUITC|nr:hypothetical protein GUITHDRAFT_141058 [Guillardia theta CCMP2712]EKX42642.1 hypothetical protein GUITHDRAFT_141058 [Guillardia theta CCMP2712]|eukprot:XP_005829622.1 hypothetical protein GUITHDRAFT_141058 [Guillardia theta CCMP2712]
MSLDTDVDSKQVNNEIFAMMKVIHADSNKLSNTEKLDELSQRLLNNVASQLRWCFVDSTGLMWDPERRELVGSPDWTRICRLLFGEVRENGTWVLVNSRPYCMHNRICKRPSAAHSFLERYGIHANLEKATHAHITIAKIAKVDPKWLETNLSISSDLATRIRQEAGAEIARCCDCMERWSALFKDTFGNPYADPVPKYKETPQKRLWTLLWHLKHLHEAGVIKIISEDQMNCILGFNLLVVQQPEFHQEISKFVLTNSSWAARRGASNIPTRPVYELLRMIGVAPVSESRGPKEFDPTPGKAGNEQDQMYATRS